VSPLRKQRWVANAIVWSLAVSTVLALWLDVRWRRRHLQNTSSVTGWCLLVVIFALAGFNGRKKLSTLPLGRAAWWLKAHVAGGIATLAIFWLHTGTLWPTGGYERVLAVLFYAVNLSGLAGLALQKLYPPALTRSGIEVIFERIPEEVASLREQAEGVVAECTTITASGVLAQYYLETFDWFFRRPRFAMSHAVGGENARAWLRNESASITRTLGAKEQEYLQKLTALAERKINLDFQYVAQFLMKCWLLVHVPLAAAMIALALWHVLVVYVYIL
jgi:hypothetical protein